jgi:hypothetical protein
LRLARQIRSSLPLRGRDKRSAPLLSALTNFDGSKLYSFLCRFGSFSAASNVTGVLTDVHAVARVLHRHGAFAFFDFAAAGPYVPIDMHPAGDPEGPRHARFLSPHTFAGGPQRSEAKPEPWTEAMEIKGSSPEQLDLHVRNFLDAIRTRERPIADVEDGHRTATTCHLANISLRLGRGLQWNPETERIINDKEAAAMLTRPYRKPWDGVLRSLLS